MRDLIPQIVTTHHTQPGRCNSLETHISKVASLRTPDISADFEDLVDEREKSASSNDDVARMQVSICLTLGRAGLVKAQVREVKAKEAFEVDNTVKGVAAGEQRTALDSREGGDKGATMS